MNADTNLTSNASNEAQWNMGPGSTLNIYNSRFNQDGGSLGADSSNHIAVYNGGFNLNGGVVYGTVDLSNSFFSTSVSSASGTVFNVMAGTGATLNGNLAANANVNVYADNVSGGNTLYVQHNAYNYGSIKLIATNGYGVDFVIGNRSETFYNAGTMNFAADHTTSTSVYGNLVNSGGIYVNGYTLFNGNVNNNGIFLINKGGIAEIGATILSIKTALSKSTEHLPSIKARKSCRGWAIRLAWAAASRTPTRSLSTAGLKFRSKAREPRLPSRATSPSRATLLRRVAAISFRKAAGTSTSQRMAKLFPTMAAAFSRTTGLR